MSLIWIVKAEYVDKYKINLSFNDGLEKVVDLHDCIFNGNRKIFNPLKDVDFFKDFTQNSWTIEWKNGLDFAPEYLYKLAQNKISSTTKEYA